jgi:hypothetical protein
MYPKQTKLKRKAATHRGRKKYSVEVKKEVHDSIMTVARVLHASPGAVIERLLKE